MRHSVPKVAVSRLGNSYIKVSQFVTMGTYGTLRRWEPRGRACVRGAADKFVAVVFS